MKSISPLTLTLVAGLLAMSQTVSVNGQQLDFESTSRRAEDTASTRSDESASNEDESDENEEAASTTNALDGQFASNNWPHRSIREIKISLNQQARTPQDRSDSLQSFGRNGGLPTTQKLFAWSAPNIHYQPLYFEDVALERYGQTAPLHQQAVRSGIHFFKSFALLPYQMLHDNPHECDSPLGFCRPGTCVPRTVQRQYFGSILPK